MSSPDNSGKKMFREKSLERLSSPERLDQLLQIVDRRSWIPLGAMAVLVALIVGWSYWGRIPVFVEGPGVLIRPRGVVELQAPAAGYVSVLHVNPGDPVAADQVLALISQPDLENQLENARSKVRELVRQNHEMLRSQFDVGSRASTSVESVDLDSYRKLAIDLREESLESIRNDRQLLEEQYRVAESMKETLGEQWDGQKKLLKDGILAASDLLSIEQDYMESLTRVSQISSQLQDLNSRELKARDEYLQRIQRIDDREQEVAEVRREISRLQALLEKESHIVSEHDGHILELNAKSGEYLPAGARLGSMVVSSSDEISKFESVSYFTIKDGKRIRKGMDVQISPDTVERERYGSIRGKIGSVSHLSVTLEQVEAVVGTRELAEKLAGGGYLIQVEAVLTPADSDADEENRFVWTSKDGPDSRVTEGTTTVARVVIENRQPISFVLPIFRRAAGID